MKKYNPRKHKLPPFRHNGILLVDKPADWTSFDVVNFTRARFNIPKVGHCGTLDPAATGLLVLVLGKFTKLSQKFSGEDKTYEAVMLLGTETDTQDMDGEIISENDYSSVTEQSLIGVMERFKGEQQQMPPMVSAVKKDGKRLYELARKGMEVEREAKDITIHSTRLGRFEPPYVSFSLKCSKGTYVRTLCSDMGKELGCGAALYSLRRTESGSFSLDDAVDIETLKSWDQERLYEHISSFLHRKLSKMQNFSSF